MEGALRAEEDIELGYRDQAELERWRARCPIARYRKVLLSEKVLRIRFKRPQ